MNKPIILTGDRPTGQLHLGHYVGSLENRIKLQDSHQQFIMIADMQALTDNAANPQKVQQNLLEVALDYLAVGIDPAKSTIFIQSAIPELCELTLLYLNLVSVARLQRNPTVKNEMLQKGYAADVPAGFLMYPVSQAADITAFKASIVPVGEDQLPVIEQTNEIVRKFNSLYGSVLVEAQGLLSAHARLAGLDGAAKMSKSLGNAIYLADDSATLKQKIMRMFTDPKHLRIEDPGQIDGNMVFTYLDIFATDKAQVSAFKQHYQRGGLGDVKLKNYLFEILEAQLAPIRQRREELSQDKGALLDLLHAGSQKARSIAAQTLSEVRQAIGLVYY